MIEGAVKRIAKTELYIVLMTERSLHNDLLMHTNLMIDVENAVCVATATQTETGVTQVFVLD